MTAVPKDVAPVKDKFIQCGSLQKILSKTVNVLSNLESLSDAIILLVELGKIQYVVKLTPYKFNVFELQGAEKIRRNYMEEIDCENKILTLFREEILDANVSPCLIRIVDFAVCSDFNSDFSKVKSTGLTPGVYDSLVAWSYRVSVGIYKPSYNLEMNEACAYTLGRYLKNYRDTPLDYVQLKSMLFMVMYTLYRIRKLYPEFRHRDLHTGNILIMPAPDYTLDTKNLQVLRFVDKQIGTFEIPFFGLVPKIADFGHASIPERDIRSVGEILMPEIRMIPKNDEISLMHRIWVECRPRNLIGNLLSAIDPARVFEYPVPNRETRGLAQILTDPIFKEYRGALVDDSRVFHTYDG